MKPPIKQRWKFSPAISAIMTALTLVSVLGATSMTPALGKDNNGHQDNGWHKGEQHSKAEPRRQSNYYRDRGDAYYYSAPVYAPPPVYYAPQPSPGITLFFPLDIRR